MFESINLQDFMLLLQVVFPLSQPGQRLPRLLQAVLPAPQLHVCKGDQVKINWHLALQNVVCGDVNGSLTRSEISHGSDGCYENRQE